jgi:uncharacterized membrane protein
MHHINVNNQHKENLSFSERLAVKITNAIGTMITVIIFIVIGGMSLIGALTNNPTLTLTFGAFSSYFLQLVLLPLIMVGQNVQQRHAELRADNDYDVNIDADKQIKALRQDIKDIKKLLKKKK